MKKGRVPRTSTPKNFYRIQHTMAIWHAFARNEHEPVGRNHGRFFLEGRRILMLWTLES